MCACVRVCAHVCDSGPAGALISPSSPCCRGRRVIRAPDGMTGCWLSPASWQSVPPGRFRRVVVFRKLAACRWAGERDCLSACLVPRGRLGQTCSRHPTWASSLIRLLPMEVSQCGCAFCYTCTPTTPPSLPQHGEVYM